MFDITFNKDAKYFYMKCLLFFTTEEKLKEHNTYFINCNTNNQPAKLILPPKDEAFIQFKNHKNKFRCPFVIYADFESLLEENTTGKNIEIKHLHKACSYMFNVVSDFDEYKFEPKIFRGENAIQNFLDEKLKTKDEIMKIIHGYKPMIISKSEQKEYEKSNKCHICEKQINTTLNDVKSDPDYRRATSVCGNTKFSVEQVYRNKILKLEISVILLVNTLDQLTMTVISIEIIINSKYLYFFIMERVTMHILLYKKYQK